MSYTAIITVAHVRPHPNADKLQLATCLGNQVVVGLDTKEGDLGIFFPTDGQLSHEYCVANNLYTLSAQAKLGLTPAPAGYLSDKRRVRAQRFRGERSDGLWLPLSSLSWTGVSTDSLKEGDSFTEFGGYGIALKYYTPATLRAMRGGTPRTRKENPCFPKHEDTKQFRFFADSVPEDSVIYITEKLHGTSGRYGYVLDETPLSSWKKFLNTNLFHRGFFKEKSEYTYLNGSRNVTLGSSKDSNGGFYGTNNFRHEVTAGLSLHKGEIIFFEIVGWVNDGTPIMPPHDVTKTGLKDIQKTYGDKIEYIYGQPVGTRKIYVYAIKNVNEDGILVELSWQAMVGRCNQLGLSHVPLLWGPTTLGHLAHIHSCDGREALRRQVELLTDGPSILSTAQIREGVVVRVESKDGVSQLKQKQFAFGVLEGFWKEQEEAIDLEEIS